MTDYMYGTYIGDDPELVGKTALLMWKDDETVLAQFDDLKNLPIYLTHGWVTYKRTCFELRLADYDTEQQR